MEINPDSKVADGVSTLVMFIVLNVVYLLCCVPIVTIGAASAALLDVMHRFANEERGHLIRGFFDALRRDWKPASLVYLMLGVPIAILLFASTFWFSFGGLAIILGVVTAAAAVYAVAALVWACAQVARFEAPAVQTVKNALFFPMAHPLLSFGILIVLALAPAFTIAFHPAFFLYLTVGAALSAFVVVRLTNRAFASH